MIVKFVSDKTDEELIRLSIEDEYHGMGYTWHRLPEVMRCNSNTEDILNLLWKRAEVVNKLQSQQWTDRKEN